jgi:hypothetical protein
MTAPAADREPSAIFSPPHGGAKRPLKN